MADKFFIGPLDKGQQQNVKPWLIMDTAFQLLRNAYTWRGRVRKRPGARVMNQTVPTDEQQQLTRLRINIGMTPGPINIPGSALVTQLAIGQMFSVLDDYFTVYQVGAGVVTLSTDSGITCTIDSVALPNTVTFVGAPAATDVWWYPAKPVMELGTYATTMINDENLIAFDTVFPYIFTYATGWDWLAGGAANNTWSATDADFFSTENWRGATSNTFLFFVTNNTVADAMRYYDGTNWNAFGSAATTPINAAADFIVTCKIIKAFKDRLLLFNVTENIAAVPTVFVNRIRFSQNGSPVAANAWREDIAGLGGFLDAPVKEAITAVEFIKDRLIVFFEDSTWELVYTNNEILPFRFQKINTELGVESLHSVIPFDQYAIGFGNVGIHQCNGINVNRIDELIPDEIFEVSNANAGIARVTGIRDYFTEAVYWSYQSSTNNTGGNNKFPNKVLFYNYRNESWAQFDDSITAFGNFQLTQTLEWKDVSTTWDQFAPRWEDAELQDRFRAVIAGNQEGFTFIFDTEKSTNSICLQITDVLIVSATIAFTVINHNLPQNSYVYINNVNADDPSLETINNAIFQIKVLTPNSFSIQTATVLTGNYLGGGTITRVSEIEILTKQFNFYNEPGREIALDHVDFLVANTKDRTAQDPFMPGQIEVDCYLSSTNVSSTLDAQNTLSSFGNGTILETSPYADVPYEQQQKIFWHRIYFNQTGEFVQLHFYWNDTMLLDPGIVFLQFELNGMLFYVKPTKTLGY